ncbi:MAG: DUF192 domain-containing protein [Pseudomonadota bacterium]|nr:DUF192 domain-containing protein [Pseudomonadota bacterium]
MRPAPWRGLARAWVLVLLMWAAPAWAGEATVTATIDSGAARHHFQIELAITADQRARGLMGRRDLAPDGGMLFIFPAVARQVMWMKNTPLPLDMLFLDADGRIVRIVERTVPFSTAHISSRRPVKAVLELRGGTAGRLGLKVGDRLTAPALDRPLK